MDIKYSDCDIKPNAGENGEQEPPKAPPATETPDPEQLYPVNFAVTNVYANRLGKLIQLAYEAKQIKEPNIPAYMSFALNCAEETLKNL